MPDYRRTSNSSPLPSITQDHATQTIKDNPPVEMRVHFEEFAAQLRSRRHAEHKRRMLEHRRRHLHKAISLSRRLHRIGSWVHDGLVEIAGHQDSAGFVRVQQHMQDLTDICFSQWSHEIQFMDPAGPTSPDAPVEREPFFSKLSPSSQQDCVDFIESVRSNPRVLIDRFKAVSPDQLSALSTSPRFQNLSSSILTSLSPNRGRSSQKKRIQSYAKILEDYVSSFDRQNPMSFLLHDCYGADSALEDQLLLSTWSRISAILYQESPLAFHAIFPQVCRGFTNLGGWRARERLELFLMDVLQRGSFLLVDPSGDSRSLRSYTSDNLDTDQARGFFDEAVRDLFRILYLLGGGFPRGLLDLAKATIGRFESIEEQSAFRGVVFDWYLKEFLQLAITYPEVCMHR